MLRIVYAGSPEISATVLSDIISSKEVEVVLVLTNAPSAKGRHKTLEQTPVAQIAKNANIPVLEPEKLDADTRAIIEKAKPDILVCFAYGKIFGPKFMSLFPKGGINLHTSLLPKYRGASPVPSAILAGEKETGSTVQRLAAEMDKGDILLQKRMPLLGTENSTEVLNFLTGFGSEMILEVLTQIEEGTENPIEQNENEASYCSIFKKEDGIIEWGKSAEEICAKVRALYSWPTAFTKLQETFLTIHNASVFQGAPFEGSFKIGEIIGIDKKQGILIQTGDGVLAVQNLQKQGKKAMNWKDFVNGSKNLEGQCCTNP